MDVCILFMFGLALRIGLMACMVERGGGAEMGICYVSYSF